MADTIRIPEEPEQSYDTSDKEQVNTARKKASRTKADRLKFIAAAMTHEQGRAWFFDLLVFCKTISTPFNDDPYRTAFNCGMSNVGLRIMGDIQEAAPDQYLIMIKESNSR